MQIKPRPQVQQGKAVLMQLLKKKRQKDGEDLLNYLTSQPQHEDLSLALKHNTFGGFCLQAGDLEKANSHFIKAKEIICDKYKIPFSNYEINMGNLEGQKKNYKSSAEHYENAIEISPYNTKNKIKLPQQSPIDHKKYSFIIYSERFNSQPLFTDAHTNLAVMCLQLDEINKAFDYCSKALELDPYHLEANINFTDILRQLGKKQEAITLTWNYVIELTRQQKPQYNGFEAIKIKNWTKVPFEGQKKINVLCVKWGTRYSSTYVNKLYSGIKRHTTWQFEFYCFTQDPSNLHPQIKVKQLQQGWKKWWGKVSLFKDNQIKGKRFYIDLDMIITGNLDQIFEYDGEFATLRSGDLACEKNHKEGYNSSVMIWNSDILLPVYFALKDNFQNISKGIVRFDFWLEMTVKNADYLQVLYPGQVVDFLANAKEQLPENARIVCFARKPKPDDYPALWIKEHWIE